MADQYFLDVNGLSKHLGTDVEYNERNQGFGITREQEENDLLKIHLLM